MAHLQWETTASPERDAPSPAGDAVSSEGDLLVSPNFGISHTTPEYHHSIYWYIPEAEIPITSNRRAKGLFIPHRDLPYAQSPHSKAIGQLKTFPR
jgi:hypothetical protein